MGVDPMCRKRGQYVYLTVPNTVSVGEENSWFREGEGGRDPIVRSVRRGKVVVV